MGRLRIRNPRNSDWLDICQSEWYVRNPANDGWRRILPSRGLRARHGTDNYWVNIDCLSEDECGDDAYGGTPDGTGSNGSGPKLGGPDGGPGGPGGSRDPWGGWGGGYWGSGGPWGGGVSWGGGHGHGGAYPWGPGGTWGGGYNNGDVGGWNGGGSPGGPGGGTGGPGGPGNPPGSVGGGNSSGPGNGTWNNSYGCGQTVADQHYHEMPDPDYQQYRSYYHTLPNEEGNVHIRFLSTSGRQRYRIYYGNELLLTTERLPARRPGEIAPRSIEYFYWEGTKGGDGIVRVEVEGTRDSIFLYNLFCPNELDQILPCQGLFSGGPQFSGKLAQENMHDMGDRKGVIEMQYHFMWTAAKCEVFHGGKLIASSPGFTQTGTPASNWHNGILSFEFDPEAAGGDTIIVVRITSTELTQGWMYNIWCPDPTLPRAPGAPAVPGNGSINSPKWCGEDNGLTLSGGAGITDTYYDLGEDEGSVRVRFHMFDIPDRISVYQEGNLVASTDGFVSGEDAIFFDYYPENGREIRVRVEGSGDGGDGEWEQGETSWIYVVDCAELTVSCGERWSGSREKPVFTEFDIVAPANSFALVEYTTVNTGIGIDSGAPNHIQVEDDGVILEDTLGEVYRWEDHAYGTLPVPVSGKRRIGVKAPGARDFWRVITFCPIVHSSTGPRFAKFSQGLPKLKESSEPQPSGTFAGARQVHLSGDRIMIGNSAFMAVNMFHTESGNVHFSMSVDDHGSILIMSEGGALEHVLSAEFGNPVTETVNVGPGTHFIYVLVENGPHNTPGWFLLKAVDEVTNKPILISSADWRGGMFETERSFPSGNSVIMPEVEAMMFDSDSQATQFMADNAPPTLQEVFNDWARTDGDAYYPNAEDSEGNAAAWYYDSARDRFIQGNNTSVPNSILSSELLESYEFAATLTSADADDDTIGLVLAARVVDGTPHLLVVARTKGGTPPDSGYGLLYVVGNRQNVLAQWGGHGDNLSGGWSGARTRIHIRRRGDAFVINTTRFNGGDFPTANFNLDDFPQTAMFKGPQRYGYFTHSQRGSTYENVVKPFSAGRIFSVGTNKTWEAQNGQWVYLGTTESPGRWLDWPCVARNPETGNRYYVYRKVARKVGT